MPLGSGANAEGKLSPLDHLGEELARLEGAGLRRRLETIEAPTGPVLRLTSGETLVDFSSNDYLGLAADPRLARAAAAALERWGVGARASRLIVGSLAEHEALENELAAFKGTEAALLFNSGYHANTGVIPALVGEGDLLVSDALNHASIIDGARLSKARIVVTPHNDLAAVDRALREPARRRMVVVDSLFSMDGDLAPLRDLRTICDRHGAILYVDEAHATGVLGPTGAGACEEAGIAADVQMGTLGKALGSFGAYVAGPSVLREWLIQRARSFVFTTALPPAICAASSEALRIVRSEPERRARVLALSRRFAEGCERLGFDVLGSRTPVVPVIVGDPQRAVSLSQALRLRGILAKPIRPPTVPEGTSRLRFAISAAHTEEQIDAALAALGEIR